MNIFFGILSKRENKTKKDLIKKALDYSQNIMPDGKRGSWVGNILEIGIVQNVNAPQSTLGLMPYYDEQSGIAIVSDARIDYREDLLIRLDETEKCIYEIPDSQLILKAYLKWGKDCLKYLFGDFSFAIWDDLNQELFCARDHFGIRPFYYYEDDEQFVFSSEISLISILREKSFEADDKVIANCILGISSNKAETMFSKVYKVLPAHYCVVFPGMNSRWDCYWNLTACSDYSDYSLSQAIEGLEKRLVNAIEERTRSKFPVGCELSGGLDSSGITSIASDICKSKGQKFYAFSHGLSDLQKETFFPFKDEMEYSMLLVEMKEIQNHYVFTGEDEGNLYSLLEFISKTTLPVYQNYSFASDQLFEKAKEESVRVLLSGFGGDEGISYQGGDYLNEILHRMGWREFLKVLHTVQDKYSFFKVLNFFLKKYFPVLWKFFKKFNSVSRLLHKKYFLLPLRRSIRKHHTTLKRYISSSSFGYEKSIQMRQFKLLTHDSTQIRFELSIANARTFGIEYRFPFFDVKLVEYFYSLPSKYKYNSEIGRFLYREVLRGKIPEKIRLLDDKSGAAVPNVISRMSINEDEFMDIIKEGEKNNAFHYINYKKLLRMYNEIVIKNGGRKIFAPVNFFSAISIVILQKWQREGKIDIGIKC